MSRFSPGAALAVGGAVAYLVFVLPQLDRPLMYDDANFALAIKAVVDTGLPYGNQGWMSERGDFSQREQWALWHPPLYIYADALLARVGGWTPATMRVLGVLSGLVTAGLTYRLASELTRGPPGVRSIAAGSAAALTLICPLFIQSTLVLDIDFPVLLPLTLLFVLGYLRLEDARTRWLWLVPLFGLLLWAKMTNPLPLVGIVLVWQLVRRRARRGIVHAVVIGLGGGALFGTSWLAIGGALGFPLDMPFKVNLVQWQDSADVARRAYASPGAFVEAMQPTVLWLGPGLVIVGLLAIAVRGGQLATAWRIRRADLVIGLVAILVLGYVNKNAGWFPKYQVAFVPLLAALTAPLFTAALCARQRLVLAVTLVTLTAGATVTGLLVRDQWALQRTWQVDPAAAAWFVAVILVAVVSGIRTHASAATALAALLGVSFGWSVAVDSVQLSARYQTDYWYGTSGTLDAAAWVDSHLEPQQIYVASKEVAIRTHDLRYVDQDNVVYFLSIGRSFDGRWADQPLAALVTWQREAYVADLLANALPRAGFTETARFGDYVIYEPTPTS